MDVLIKNMEMPSETSGIEIFMYNDGTTICRYLGEDRWFEVEAIELPPHGRLIDADIIKEAFEATALIEASRDKGNEQIYFDRIELVHGIVDRTPTILEAST